MITVRVAKGLVGGAVVAAALACAGSALAGGEGAFEKEKRDKGEAATPGAQGNAAVSGSVEVSASDKAAAREGEKREAGEGKEEGEEKPMMFGIDFVVGSATTPAVTQNVPAPLQPTGNTSIDASKVTTFSFLIGGSVEVAKHFEIGLRVPFQSGTIYAPSYTRGSAGIGNVELEPEYALHLNEGLELRLALGIALPTAQGTAVPDSVDAVPNQSTGIDQSGYDRAAVAHAAAMARGFEENALYEPSHFGLVPKVTLSWFKKEKWHFDPWVKLENLIATKSDEKFIGELVFGANLGYSVSKIFEPTLRVWANVPVSGADFTTVAVVEPDLRFHAGDGMFMVGVILPVAGGALTSPYAVGVRLAAGIRF